MDMASAIRTRDGTHEGIVGTIQVLRFRCAVVEPTSHVLVSVALAALGGCLGLTSQNHASSLHNVNIIEKMFEAFASRVE